MRLSRVVYSQEIRDLFQYHRTQWKKLTWIAEALNISYNTLKIWNSKASVWETFKDKRFWNSTKQKKFSDEELKLYIENNVNATLQEIGIHFSVTDVAILKRLRNMNYSYKKRGEVQRKGWRKTQEVPARIRTNKNITNWNRN